MRESGMRAAALGWEGTGRLSTEGKGRRYASNDKLQYSTPRAPGDDAGPHLCLGTFPEVGLAIRADYCQDSHPATEETMRKEFGQLEGETRITDDLALYGLCTGDIVVESGGYLHLYGMCAGDLEVKAGGACVVYGMCTGNVTNSGGKLEISGMVVGHLEKNAGTTTVLPTARVNVEP